MRGGRFLPLRDSLIAVSNCLMSYEDRARLFSEVCGEGSRGNQHKLLQGKIQRDVKKKIFRARVKILLGDVHNWPGQSLKPPGLSWELALL